MRSREGVRELERRLDRQTLEVEILQKALSLARAKTNAAAAVMARTPGRFVMETTTSKVGVVHSNLIKRQAHAIKPRRQYCRRPTVGFRP
jgi:hypothetical protein